MLNTAVFARPAPLPRRPRTCLPALLALLLFTGPMACGFDPPAANAPGLLSAPGDPAEALATIVQAAGEPTEGYPNYEERVILYHTNRTRAEPSAFKTDPPFSPSPPLRFELQLSKAARWQARHIIEEGCWCADHSSCCTIGRTTGNEVACLDASTGCGVTSVGARVAFFSSKYSGENAAMGYPNGAAAVGGWISSTTGHWENLNEASHTLLGPGQHRTGYVQVFGRDGQPPPVIEDGIHITGGQGTTFGTTYYQPSTGGPRTALVIIDGECHELDLAYGTPEHGAFEVTKALGPGCHRYYFHFTDGRGEDHTYPTTGSFAVAVGDAGECPFYITTRPADTCSPSGQPCEHGQTRRCYTGPFGTEGVGECKAGSERCVGGQWSGECRNQVHPEDEACDNGLDDNCDGRIDEFCPGSGDEDAGHVADGGDDVTAGGETLMPRERSSSGCSQAPTTASPGHKATWLLAAIAGLLVVRARRRRRRLQIITAS